jgi:hypothetical protein
MSQLSKLRKESIRDPEIKLVLTREDFEKLIEGLSIRKEVPGRSAVHIILSDFPRDQAAKK